jgi:hypothetical protein
MAKYTTYNYDQLVFMPISIENLLESRILEHTQLVDNSAVELASLLQSTI